MNPKISIIIPVYNSEKYILECIQSLTEQTYENIEIILVDDGSKDRSPAICDDCANKDTRIKVIHKLNGGTSSARNAGLEVATGEYITFMDNDDYWNRKNCLEQVVVCLNESNADILMHDCFVYWMDNNITIAPSNTCRRSGVVHKTALEALKHIISHGGINRCVWSKIIKTSLIREHGLCFPEGMRNEDTRFVGQLLLYATSYDWFDDSFYVYRKGHESAQTTSGITCKLLKDLKIICVEYINYVIENIKDSEYQKILFAYIAYPYCVWMGQSVMVADRKKILADRKKMKEYSYILKYNIDPSVKKVAFVFKILGFDLTSRLLGYYIKKNNHYT